MPLCLTERIYAPEGVGLLTIQFELGDLEQHLDAALGTNERVVTQHGDVAGNLPQGALLSAVHLWVGGGIDIADGRCGCPAGDLSFIDALVSEFAGRLYIKRRRITHLFIQRLGRKEP